MRCPAGAGARGWGVENAKPHEDDQRRIASAVSFGQLEQRIIRAVRHDRDRKIKISLSPPGSRRHARNSAEAVQAGERDVEKFAVRKRPVWTLAASDSVK